MPITWDAAADAKLFLGVLNQLRDAKLALDHKELAKFMGPDCLEGAVKNRIVRLRKRAEEGPSAAAENDGENATPATPAGTPQKRKRGRPAGSPSKKAKAVNEEGGSTKEKDTVTPQKEAVTPKKEEAEDKDVDMKEDNEEEAIPSSVKRDEEA